MAALTGAETTKRGLPPFLALKPARSAAFFAFSLVASDQMAGTVMT